MADNQFIARNGLIALDDSQITGSLSLTGAVTGSIFSGSFVGDGSQLTGVTGATTASYVEYANVANKPTLVSGSSQITYSGLSGIPSGIVSGSSQITYSGLTGIPSGIVSGSSQVVYSGLTGIPSGIVSGSSQVTYSGLTGIPSGIVSGSSQITYSGLTGIPLGIVSGSSQVSYTGLSNIPSGIVSGSTQVAALGFATTGSNTFQANQTITGSLFISQNLIVAGSSSIQYISSSVVDIADNIITVNAFNPGIRFGGLAVADSGSSPRVSGSILFDSVKDQWIFVHENQTVTTSSVILMGPETYNDLGNESYISANRLPKGSGIEHLRDSNITDTGTLVTINSNTTITGSVNVTGSLTVNGIAAGTVRSIGLSSSTSGVTIGGSPITTSGSLTLTINTATATLDGLLSSTDWSTFNNKQNALTNPITGTGTSGQIAYFTGTTAISSESNLFWDATNDRLGISNASPGYKLSVSGSSNSGIFLKQGSQIGDTPSTNFYSALTFENTSTTNAWSIGYSQGAKFSINYFDASSTYTRVLTATAGGNVGIGTINPAGELHIVNASGTGQPVLELEQLNAGSNILQWKGSAGSYLGVIQNEGNVGIGTTSPTAPLDAIGVRLGRNWSLSNRATIRLDANGTSSPADILFGHTSAANQTGWDGVYWSISSRAAENGNKFLIYRGGGNPGGSGEAILFAIQPNGNVGIGTDSPTPYTSGNVVLHINTSSTVSDIKLTNATSGTGATQGGLLRQDGNAMYLWNGSNGLLAFGTNNTERMRITAGGSVGIGTTSPDAIFHVALANAGGVGGQVVIDNPASSTLGNTAEISFLTDAGASGAGTRNARMLAVNENAGNGAANLQFHTWNGSASAERMRITAAGAVAIGATSTNGRLGVRGTTDDSTAYAFEAANSSGNSILIVRNDSRVGIRSVPLAPLHVASETNSDDANVQRWDYNTNTGYQLILKQTVTSGVVRWNFSQINNSTTYNNVLVLDRGNVGIGTTSPSNRLHVVSSDNEGIFMQGSSNGGHWFNFRSANSNLWSMGAQPGLMGWYNRTDSTYKAVITDAGNIGIGTTSPGARLDVCVVSSTLTNNIKFGDSCVGYLASGASGVFLSDNSGTSRLMFTHTGNVGIGTNSPSSRLSVCSTTACSTVVDVQGCAGQLFSVTDNLVGEIFAVSDISGIPILSVNSNGTVSVDSKIAVGANHTVSGAYASVLGGRCNTASGNCSKVGGGFSNNATGLFSSVGGGNFNAASGFSATIGGGESNTSSNYFSTIGGGLSNTASGCYSFIGGGKSNCASGDRSSISGGISNTVSGYNSAVVGGCNNFAACNFNFIGGGTFNTTELFFNSVVGGAGNCAYGNRSAVLTGQSNCAGCYTSAIGSGVSQTNSANYEFRVQTLSKASGTFRIDHPNPSKTCTHYLSHSFVESPTAGDNIYRYKVNVVNGTAVINLPSYYKYLNENDQIWVTPQGHFGIGYGEINIEQTQLTIYSSVDGEYNVLLIGTRKDTDARNSWSGVEVYK